MLKAIIFDKDGVLVHSERARFNFVQNVALRFDVKIDNSLIHKFAGITTDNILKNVLQNHLTVEQGQEVIKEMSLNYNPKVHLLVEPIPITVNFISTYNGPLKFAIATMGSLTSVNKIIDHFNISDKFTVIMTRDHVTHHKPHPEIYIKTCVALGFNPSDCAVIEDTVVGAEAAIEAGCQCYILLNGLNEKEQFKDLQIADFIQTKDDLERIVGDQLRTIQIPRM